MRKISYSRPQLLSLVILRLSIGWYFLYEGIDKLYHTGWTSYAYLLDSKGWFAPLFTWIAENPTLLKIADTINIYGLIIIGVLLILGLFSRIGLIGSATLLLLYYLSHPPLINVDYLISPGGAQLWVDKNLIILFAVIVLMFFPTSKRIGIDRLIYKNKA